MAMIGSFISLGELLAFNTMVDIANAAGDYKIALWAAFGVSLLALLAGVLLVILDYYGEKRVKTKRRKTGDVIRFSDIKQFPKAYWSIVGIGISFFCVIFPFISFASDFLQYDHGFNEEESGRYVGILSLVALIVGPCVGLSLDKIGMRAISMSFGVFLTLPALYILAFSTITPVVTMVLIGLAYSFIPAVLWPSLAIIIPEERFATAYGLQMSAANSVLVFVYAVVGVLAEEYSAAAALMLMAAFAFMGFVMTLIWNYLDYYDMNSIANRPTPAPSHNE